MKVTLAIQWVKVRCHLAPICTTGQITLLIASIDSYLYYTKLCDQKVFRTSKFSAKSRLPNNPSQMLSSDLTAKI